MFPLKILRFFDPLPERTLPAKRSTPHAGQSPANADSVEPVWPEVERRKKITRNATERREKQDSILLNTRKTQGRRHNPGRRITDKDANSMAQVRISIKI